MSTRHIFDDAPNDSDKSIVVPEDKRYRVLYGSITLTTSAIGGNRQFDMEVTNENSNVVFHSIAGVNQTASSTKEYHLSPNVSRDLAFIDVHLDIPIPTELILLPGWTIRLHDSATIDPTGDDMTICIVIEDRELNKFDPQAG